MTHAGTYVFCFCFFCNLCFTQVKLSSASVSIICVSHRHNCLLLFLSSLFHSGTVIFRFFCFYTLSHSRPTVFCLFFFFCDLSLIQIQLCLLPCLCNQYSARRCINLMVFVEILCLQKLCLHLFCLRQAGESGHRIPGCHQQRD